MPGSGIGRWGGITSSGARSAGAATPPGARAGPGLSIATPASPAVVWMRNSRRFSRDIVVFPAV
jgi:hypothetical protein